MNKTVCANAEWRLIFITHIFGLKNDEVTVNEIASRKTAHAFWRVRHATHFSWKRIAVKCTESHSRASRE